MRSAYEVVAEVVNSNPDIECVSLVSYEENPTWRDRLQAGEGNIGLPLFLEGLNQDRRPRVLTSVPRMEAAAEKLREIAGGLGANRLLGVCSMVRLAGGQRFTSP